MPKLGIETLTGKSGQAYTFNAYSRNMRFNDFIPGVYLIARITGDETKAIYLHDSDNVDATLKNHDKQACFDEHTSNRICFLKNASAEVRKKILADLLPVLKPVCND